MHSQVSQMSLGARPVVCSRVVSQRLPKAVPQGLKALTLAHSMEGSWELSCPWPRPSGTPQPSSRASVHLAARLTVPRLAQTAGAPPRALSTRLACS